MLKAWYYVKLLEYLWHWTVFW